MRKIKLTVQCRVPSWNYCNLDVPTADGRYSKEKCRFCVSSKQGHYCSLYDAQLTTDPHFIHKVPQCITATAGFAVSVDEPATPQVDPRFVVRETLKTYKKTVEDFVKQGYPRHLAETLATKYVTGDN